MEGLLRTPVLPEFASDVYFTCFMDVIWVKGDGYVFIELYCGVKW